MSDKKVYFTIDNGDTPVTAALSGVIEILKCEMKDAEKSGDIDLYEWTIKPILMTDEEYEKLPEVH